MRTFFRIVLPLAASSIVSGAIFAFVISFDEAVVTLFLTGPGFETLPVTMFSHIQYSNDPSVAALSTILVVFCVTLLILMMKVTKSDDDKQ
ncbi:MAG: ABC transporter permease subunit [Comamonadaceae bacterium]|nr:MAG: ABC transporter permease subunit [Comamonadaceae bacterium]